MRSAVAVSFVSVLFAAAMSASLAPAVRAGPRVRVSSDTLLPDDGATGAQAGTQAEPHLAINPTDRRNLVGGWQEQRFADGGARALGYAATFNGGRTWSEGLVPGLTRATGGEWDRATDPWIAFGRGNRVLYSSMTFGGRSGSAINVSISTNGGRSWQEPVVAYENPLELSDKQALVVDARDPAKSSNRRRFQGRVYLAWMAFRYDAAGALLGQVLLSATSDDSGENWTAPVEHTIGLVNTGPVPAVGPDGTAYLVWLSQREGERHRQIHFSRSRSGGRVWSIPRRLDEIGFLRTRDVRDGNDLVAFAVNPVSGSLHLLWADTRFTGFPQLALMSSSDRGETWSVPRRASAGNASLPVFTPTLAIDQRGHLGISYYRGGAFNDAPFATDLLFRDLGFDGLAPGAEVRVTPEKFSMLDAAYANGYFLGDYSGIAGLRRGFRLLWVDTRMPSGLRPGRNQPDVHTVRVR